MEAAMSTPDLTPEQEAHAQELAKTALQALEGDILRMTRLLASKPDSQVLGQTEFQIRDIVHQIGAKAIRAELDARQKKLPRIEHDLSSLRGSGLVQGAP
jgi:hypothetical protein